MNEEAGSSEPTLPQVVEALLHPREAMVEGVAAEDAAGFAAAVRDCALALQRLCEGDLRGMFDGPTAEGIDLDAGVVVLDLSAMRDSEALGVLMTCAGAWQQAIFRERKAESDRTGVPMRKTFCVFEEVWRVISNLAVAEWLQSNSKLCRAFGISNGLSLHKLTDFGTAGADGPGRRQTGQPGLEPGIAGFGDRCLSQLGHCPRGHRIVTGVRRDRRPWVRVRTRAVRPAIGAKGEPTSATLPASDELGTFEGLVTPSIQVPPGEYEAVVSCGSGRVGVGTIGLH